MGRQRVSSAERQRVVGRAAALTIALNVALTALRAVTGFLSGSTAVVADAANSGTDVLATLVVLGGSRIAARPPDLDHPYGHEKAEPVAAKLVGILIIFTGAVTGLGAIRALQGGGAQVGLLASLVTGGSVLLKEGLSRYLARQARRVGSQALEADAANQRTDVLASLAALVGTLGGRFGLPLLDPAMGLLVAGLIVRMGLGLYWQSVRDLMDRAPDAETMLLLRSTVAGVEGVRAVGEIKARVFGSGIYVDCRVSVDGNLTVWEGHRIAKRVKEEVMAAIPECRDVLTHINPYPGLAEEPPPQVGFPVSAGPAETREPGFAVRLPPDGPS